MKLRERLFSLVIYTFGHILALFSRTAIVIDGSNGGIIFHADGNMTMLIPQPGTKNFLNQLRMLGIFSFLFSDKGIAAAAKAEEEYRALVGETLEDGGKEVLGQISQS